MPSGVISESQPRQLTLALDEGLADRFGCLREVVAQGVYQRGLKRAAADLDEAPGNLSVQLAGDGQRKFSVDQLERYIQCTGDKTPILFLVAKYLGDQGAARDAAMEQVMSMLTQLPAMLASAGLPTAPARRRS
jgi:hypothetical protein